MLRPALRTSRLLGGLLIAATLALPSRLPQASISIRYELVPYVELLDTVRWLDLTPKQNAQLVKCALDASTARAVPWCVPWLPGCYR